MTNSFKGKPEIGDRMHRHYACGDLISTNRVLMKESALVAPSFFRRAHVSS